MPIRPVRPPAELADAGRKLWRSIAKQVAEDGLILDARELALLAEACREADMLASITAALDGEPRTVRGAQGQLVAHPLIGEARRSRQAMHSLLKDIGLTDPAEQGKGSGSRTTSWQARAAAQVRNGMVR